MNEQKFKEFVNKSSFERMVQTWKNHYKHNDLSEQGVLKHNLMIALHDWKHSEYGELTFKYVETAYKMCLAFNVCLDNFFDIE